MMGRLVPTADSDPQRSAVGGRLSPAYTYTGETAMKINEDWLSVIIAFALLVLALVGVIGGSWMIF